MYLAAEVLGAGVFDLVYTGVGSLSELTRMPCMLPSIRSWRGVPRIPALFVVCASEAMFLKLSCPFSEAMFTTTPRLTFIAARQLG